MRVPEHGTKLLALLESIAKVQQPQLAGFQCILVPSECTNQNAMRVLNHFWEYLPIFADITLMTTEPR